MTCAELMLRRLDYARRRMDAILACPDPVNSPRLPPLEQFRADLDLRSRCERAYAIAAGRVLANTTKDDGDSHAVTIEPPAFSPIVDHAGRLRSEPNHHAADFQTAAEVATALRITERKLRGLIRKHGVAVLRVGRELRFDKRARHSLKEALRSDSKSLPVEIPARSGLSVRSSKGALVFANELEATILSSRKKKPRCSKLKSSAPLGTANSAERGPSWKR